jgi:FtsH-binding integral membrane protein
MSFLTGTRTPAPSIGAAVSAMTVNRSFIWMAIGTLISALVASTVAGSAELTATVAGAFGPIVIAQLAAALLFGFLLNRLSPTVLVGLFAGYAALTGLTFGVIVQAYTESSVTLAFGAAVVAFTGAAIYGATTRRSLDSIGGILAMALFGIIGASLLNLLLGSSGLDFLIALGSVAVFTALAAYNTQRALDGRLGHAVGAERASIAIAFALYLDLVNLVLAFLRLFGRRR